MRNSKIVALVATAALLVLGAAFTSFAATYNWYQQDGAWRCADKNGDDYYAAWAKSGSDYYWLDDEGWMATEALVDDDTKYVDADGKMVKNQWVKIANDEGDEFWYYFQAGGKKAVGKETIKPVTINGKKYIFDQDGKMLTGWVGTLAGDGTVAYDDLTEDKEWTEGVYYCGGEDDGAVSLGWKQVECFNDFDEDFYDNNYWFYFGTNGKKMASAVAGDFAKKVVNGKEYIFDEYGRMKAEWQPFYNTAATASDAIGSYAWYQDAETGAKFAKGWFRVVPQGTVDPDNNTDDTAKWFYAKSGKLYESTIKTINGKKYGFNDLGEMIVGLNAVVITSTADGDVYTFEAIDDAAKITTYVDEAPVGTAEAGGVYYFSDDEDNDGSMKTGLQTLDVDGDAYSFYFSTKAGSKGLGLTGKQGNKYYYNGKKIAADDAKADYMIYAYDDALGYVEPDGCDTFKNILGSATSVNVVADTCKMISKTGVVSTSGTKKDGNGYKAQYKKIDGTAYWVITKE